MSNRYEKYKWLQLAFSEKVDRLNESYYYDKRDNEFFSVFITDLFLTDPTLNEDSLDHPYSKAELKVLRERIKRLEIHDNLILTIPRLTVDERKQMMQQFFEAHTDFNSRSELQKVITAENGKTNLDFGSLLIAEEPEKWLHFKRNFIEAKIDTFCNLQNINLNAASMWTDTKMTSVSLSLHQAQNEPLPNPTKPWWKFW